MHELRRMSGYTVLFHQAVADRLGITATELQCSNLLDLLGPMTAGRLAELTGLSSGAITGVIDRLERARVAARDTDPEDRRRVIVRSLPDRRDEFDACFDGLGLGMAAILRGIDAPGRAAVEGFARDSSTLLLQESVRLRGGTAATAPRSGSSPRGAAAAPRGTPGGEVRHERDAGARGGRAGAAAARRGGTRR
ncbi:MAG: MarR family transcriptional regulator [Nannocystaceae bacterium]|nr:MarR family transcriptional regulator [Nannocystaceae bacterium]